VTAAAHGVAGGHELGPALAAGVDGVIDADPGDEFALDRRRPAALWVVGALLLLGVVGPWIAPVDPFEQDLVNRLQPPVFLGGSWDRPLGTDGLGRDVLSGVLTGARTSLLVGVGATLLAAAVGITVGLVAGYRGGWWDRGVSGVIDLQLAFPGLLLIIVVTSYVGGSVLLVTLLLALVSWMVFARLARSMALTLRDAPFVDAARLAGSSTRRIVFRHLMPSMRPQLLTLGLLEVARLLLAEAGLSFLGFGVQQPATSWGLMIAEGQEYLRQAWWVITFPGLMIVLSVFAFNLVARSASGTESRPFTRLS
jgi:peptide/nickel transport system permease protein